MGGGSGDYGVPTGGVPRGEVVVKSLRTGAETTLENIQTPKKHNHYFKDVSHLKTIDVYRVLDLFRVDDPCIQHAVKKLLVAGGRGAGKDINKDIQEAIDSLVRWQDMRKEDADLK